MHAQTFSSPKFFMLESKRAVPVVLQSEAAECGLACLNMIVQHFGDKRTMTELRQTYGLSLRGATLKDIMAMAERLSFQCRALKIEMSDLTQLQTPAILHWEMNHFVVLTKVSKKGITIHDPAIGKRTLTHNEASKSITGIALEILPSNHFTPQKSRPKLGLLDFLKPGRGFKISLLTLLGLSALLQIFALASPYYVQTVVDDVLVQNNSALLLALAFGFGLLLVVDTFTSAIRHLLILSLSAKVQLQMSASVFQHLLSLPIDYFQKRHVGDVVSRFGSVAHIRDFLTTGLVSTLLDGLMAIVTLAVMFIYSPALTLVVLVVTSCYMAIRLALLPLSKRLTAEQLSLDASEQSHFIESIRAITPLRVYQQEAARHGEWQNKVVSSLNKGISLGKLDNASQVINKLLFGIENIVVIYIAATLVLSNSFSVGMLFAFLAYKSRFTTSFENLINQIIALRMLNVHFERLSDIVHTPKIERAAYVDALPSPDTANGDVKLTHHIQANALCYRYSANEPLIFNKLNLTITKGESIAIIGSSGSGKSTLLKCLMGLIKPTSGKIELNTPVSKIASVLQDDMCLGGTIADNITCFDDTPDNQKMVSAASLACIHDEILSMPMQYHTLVGDMGASLSGGQRQRLYLARALYRQPDILFLDEASSHLDLDNELRINQHLNQMMITRIVVAHRPQTIAMADSIYQLSEGQLHQVRKEDVLGTSFFKP